MVAVSQDHTQLWTGVTIRVSIRLQLMRINFNVHCCVNGSNVFGGQPFFATGENFPDFNEDSVQECM